MLLIAKPFQLILLVMVIGLTATTSIAQVQTAKMSPDGVGYWEYLPQDYNATTEDYPLILFFHGLGERGNGTTDLNKVLKFGAPYYAEKGENFPFIIISPQLPSGEINWPKNFVSSFVDYIYSESGLRIDTDRIYVTGLSLGGGASWFFVKHHAEMPAAIAPVAGYDNHTTDACTKYTPNKIAVWAFHGIDDPTISYNKTVRMVDAINACTDPAADPTALISLYPGVRHDNAMWSRAYVPDHTYNNPNLYEWFMQYSKASFSVSAGPDRKITLPVTSTSLNGSGSVSEGTITYLWSKVGSFNGTITNPTSAITTVNGLTTAGIYTFKLEGTDSQGNKASDEVTVTVTAGNISPIANAGNDKTIKLPTNSITLTGIGTDADGTIASYLWELTSGPSATLNNDDKAQLNVTDMQVGKYTFTLTVTDDKGATATDEVTVNVLDADNLPPIANAGEDITINLPTNAVTITGSGTDPDGTVVSYAWTQKSGATAVLNSINQPALQVSGLQAGTYEFSLTVFDDDGDSDSDIVSVIVINSNQAPSVNAGNDIAITLPTTTATLSATASDNDGTISQYYWELINGPVQPVISNANAANTTINGLSTAGQYTFKVTVTDNSGAEANDEVVITVHSAPVNIPPTANAGEDIYITLPQTELNIIGSGTDEDGSIVSYEWKKLSGPAATLDGKTTATLNITNLRAGQYIFRLNVHDNSGAIGYDDVMLTVAPEDVNSSPIANAGPDKTLTLPNNSIQLTGSGTDSDGSIVEYEWIKTSGPSATISGDNTATLSLSDLLQGLYTFELKVTDDDGAINTDEVNVTVNAANVAPIVDAGNNITITLPTSTAQLNGSAQDNDGTIATINWTQITGPSYSIDNSNILNPTLSNLTEGIYTFQITVSDDDGASNSDQVNVKVNAAVNQGPTVSAGQDKTITLPVSSINLTGSATDSDGTIASVEWTQISGNAITMTNASSYTVTIENLTAGEYTFQFKAIDDDNAQDFDQVKVTVLPESINQPPVANAGNNKTITLPVNSVTLKGTGSDPDGNIASYTWSKLSGPTSTLSNQNTAELTVTNMLEGTYIFRLTVKDNDDATATDKVTVNVLPANVNQSPTADAGPDVNLTLPNNQVTVNGKGSDADGTILIYSWEQIDGQPATLNGQNTQNLSISNLSAGVASFQLTVEDEDGAIDTDIMQVIVYNENINQSPTALAGNDIIVRLPINNTAIYGAGYDPEGNIAGYEWRKISGPTAQVSGTNSATLILSDLIEGVYTFRLTVMDSEGATASDDVKVTVLSSNVNQVPLVDAGLDRTIKLPTNSISLKGTASDIDGSITSVLWTQVTAGNATISNQNSLSTFLTNLEAGSYTFKLTVTDNNNASNSDNIVINVLPTTGNLLPHANAGADISIKLPDNSINIIGSGTDVDGTIVSYSWVKASGPTLSMARQDTSVLAVSNMVEGIYTFKLTVRDNLGAQDTDEVKVEVLPAIINTPPSVSAGPNKTLQLPNNSITIIGSASDDSKVIELLWKKVSGPSGFVMENETTTDLKLSQLTEGVYIFRLTATDENGLTKSDDMQLTVLDQELEPGNLPPTVDAGPDITIQAPESAVTLTAFGNDPDGFIDSYHWSLLPGSNGAVLDNADSNVVNISQLREGTYTFQVEVKDLNNASGYDEVNVLVQGEEALPHPHKLFSPNGDNIDDFWLIDNYSNSSEYLIILFNRAGQEILKLKDYQNNWDGTVNGRQLPDGVYYYVIRSNSSDTNLMTGSVTIIR